jgi:hypothetical protein
MYPKSMERWSGILSRPSHLQLIFFCQTVNREDAMPQSDPIFQMKCCLRDGIEMDDGDKIQTGTA